MKRDKCKVFLILTVEKGTEKNPIHAFISKDRETAKLYAKNYVEIFSYYGTFELREVANFDKNKLEEVNIFICNFRKYKCDEIRRKFEEMKRDKKLIEQAKNEKEMNKQLEILFCARRI